MLLEDAIKQISLNSPVLRRKAFNEPSLGAKWKYLVYVPGRVVEASFGPMLLALGNGAYFETIPHFDLVVMEESGDLKCMLNVNPQTFDFTQTNDDWEVLTTIDTEHKAEIKGFSVVQNG